MTKKVRIENADFGTMFKPVVQIWDMTLEGPKLVKEVVLHNPTDLTGEDVFLTSNRFLVVKEEGSVTPLDLVVLESASVSDPLPDGFSSNPPVHRVGNSEESFA